MSVVSGPLSVDSEITGATQLTTHNGQLTTDN
jgi:hypothetical protein